MTKKKIAAIRDFIVTAEKSIKNAKKLLSEVLEEENLDLSSEVNLDTEGLTKYRSGDNKIVEWVFTGEEMLGSDKNTYLLTSDNGKYQVIADGVTYNVLTAAVTHFKAEIWDSITIVLPKWKEASFAAIETVIPKEE